mmetsp:Transcript_21610/g.48808  ORF Transcript_21610/g.48808 Transcript_21610/m.48808 type:complete len:308 (+) Transcript_21610:72-995(+)
MQPTPKPYTPNISGSVKCSSWSQYSAHLRPLASQARAQHGRGIPAVAEVLLHDSHLHLHWRGAHLSLRSLVHPVALKVLLHVLLVKRELREGRPGRHRAYPRFDHRRWVARCGDVAAHDLISLRGRKGAQLRSYCLVQVPAANEVLHRAGARRRPGGGPPGRGRRRRVPGRGVHGLDPPDARHEHGREVVGVRHLRGDDHLLAVGREPSQHRGCLLVDAVPEQIVFDCVPMGLLLLDPFDAGQDDRGRLPGIREVGLDDILLLLRGEGPEGLSRSNVQRISRDKILHLVRDGSRRPRAGLAGHSWPG